MNVEDANNQINEYAEYICAGCGKIKQISSSTMENIYCEKCNGRIFYKKRTKNPTQYEAR
jgi:DNA-directed RNA polymerase subunit RPC12/RpoP